MPCARRPLSAEAAADRNRPDSMQVLPATIEATAEARSRAVTAPTGQAADRQLWVEVAKGLGIVLVVLGHAIDGVMSAGKAGAASGFAFAHFLIYTFHMPLFFVLTGYFVQRRVDRDRGRFVREVGQRIVWPYLLWSVVYLVLLSTMAGHVNKARSFDPSTVLSLLWAPIAQFWFLYAVLILHLCAVLAPRRHRAGWLLLACVIGLVAQQLITLPPILDRTVTFSPYYLAGVWMGARAGVEVFPSISPRLSVGAVALAMIWLAAASALWASGESYWGKAATMAALLGIGWALVASRAMRGPLKALFAALGRHSMAIFVLHVLLTAGARILLDRLGGQSIGPGAAVIVGTLAGVAVPVLVHRVASSLGVSTRLGLGS